MKSAQSFLNLSQENVNTVIEVTRRREDVPRTDKYSSSFSFEKIINGSPKKQNLTRCRGRHRQGRPWEDRSNQADYQGWVLLRRSRLGRRAFFSRLGSHILPSHPRDVDDDVASRLLSAPCVVVPRSLAHVGLSNVSTLFFVSGGLLAGQVHGPPRFSGPNCRVQLFNYRVSGPAAAVPWPPLHARSKCEYIHTRAHVDAFWSSPPTKREARREKEKERQRGDQSLSSDVKPGSRQVEEIYFGKLSFDLHLLPFPGFSRIFV